jgi:hypothetical protein
MLHGTSNYWVTWGNDVPDTTAACFFEKALVSGAGADNSQAVIGLVEWRWERLSSMILVLPQKSGPT